MCGIAGLWRTDASPVTEAEISRMTDLLAHRGPDASGIALRGSLGLGHRRLKIIDLSDAANQPFVDADDALVFNGEIFNYKALRRLLEKHYPFRTQSDTEVLFRALQHWGEDALERLDGQFAFAFHRRRENRLILARDHVGICPLYLIETPSMGAFASEIRPLLTFGRRALDPQGVADYFSYRYNIQNGHTLFAGVQRLAPGHYSVIDLADGRRRTRRYWRLTFAPGSGEEVATVLDRAMAAQSVADVPVGMFLSGGIDSRAVLHGFSRHVPRVEAFTLQFDVADPEVALVEELAVDYPLRSHVLPFTMDAVEDALTSVRVLEEPFGDLIICANHLLAREAARQVRVVLSGEGGDEAFLGYDHQRFFLRLAQKRRRWLAVCAAAGLAVLPSGLVALANRYPGRFGPAEQAHLRRVVTRIRTPGEAYLALVRLFQPEDLRALFTPAFASRAPEDGDTAPLLDIFRAEADPARASMRAEIEQLTLIVNLTKQDRFTMRHGLEARVPLVSREVLELAGSMSTAHLLRKPVKADLQAYCGKTRLPKRAFSVLGSAQYRAMLQALFDRYADKVSVEECGVLRPEAVAGLRRKIEAGGLLEVKRAMTVLVFMIWWRAFREYVTDIL